MAKTRRISRGEKKLHAYCDTNANKGLKTMKNLHRLLKKKSMTKKKQTKYLTTYMKECKDMYMEKNSKMVPNCDEYTRRVFKFLDNFTPKGKKGLTKKQRAKITKASMKDCKKKYPVF